MEGMTLEEKEYEALTVVRDILLLFCNYISESTGSESIRLRSAFEYVDGLTAEAGKLID